MGEKIPSDILVVITARGGSKGIPRKNVRPLAGKPLIAWAIEAALQAQHKPRVIVSTDDEEIAAVARQYGAEVPFMRPSEIAQDLSHTIEALVHALDFFRESEGYIPKAVVLLPPTAPLVTAQDIDTGIDALLKDESLDSVRPIIESPKHPFKTFHIEENTLAPFFPDAVTGFSEAYDLPRQLFPKAYVYSGTFQVMWPKTILEMHSLSGKRMGFFLMSADRAINIDSLLDFDFADMLMCRRIGCEKENSIEPSKETH